MEILDTIQDSKWILKAGLNPATNYVDRKPRYRVEVYRHGAEYESFDFGVNRNKGNFDAMWKKVKSGVKKLGCIDSWLKENYWRKWAENTYGYYWIDEEVVKIGPNTTLAKKLSQWEEKGFKFEVHEADIGGDPYEYHSWTDDHLCVMFDPFGKEIGAVDPWELDTVLKIHEAIMPYELVECEKNLAYLDGHDAYLKGNKCPYDKGSERHDKWWEGYYDAMEDWED